jgi:hypothetical protein
MKRLESLLDELASPLRQKQDGTADAERHAFMRLADEVRKLVRQHKTGKKGALATDNLKPLFDQVRAALEPNTDSPDPSPRDRFWV